MPYPTFAAGQTLTASMLQALQWKEVYQGTDATKTSSTTYSNTSIVVPVVAGATYRYRLVVSYFSKATPDSKFKWTVPTNGSVTRFTNGLGRTEAGTDADSVDVTRMRVQAAGDDSIAGGVSSTNSDKLAYNEEGEMYGGNGGSITLQFAQNTSAADTTTLYAESVVYYQRIA